MSKQLTVLLIKPTNKFRVVDGNFGEPLNSNQLPIGLSYTFDDLFMQ